MPEFYYKRILKTWKKDNDLFEIISYRGGDIVWYKNGEYHRLDGPAIEYITGSKYWCINDIRYLSQLHYALGLLKYGKNKRMA